MLCEAAAWPAEPVSHEVVREAGRVGGKGSLQDGLHKTPSLYVSANGGSHLKLCSAVIFRNFCRRGFRESDKKRWTLNDRGGRWYITRVNCSFPR